MYVLYEPVTTLAALHASRRERARRAEVNRLARSLRRR